MASSPAHVASHSRVALLVVATSLLLVACGSGGATTSTSTPDGTQAGATGTSPTPVTGQPPANVTTDKSVTDWVSGSCGAAKKLQLGMETPDASELQSDPQKAMKALLKQWSALPAKMNAIADELQQIGAPDIPGGEEWTDTYIDGLRTMADAFQQGVNKANAAGGGLASLEAVGKSMDTAKVKAAIAKFQAVDKKLQASQELKAAIEADPTCKSLEKD